jgi:hypothetical protein
MRKLVLLCASLCAMAFVVPTVPALAQLRVWVNNPAGVPAGNDSTCVPNVTTPCATFAKAITLAGFGGEINCLSDGDYGPVTISASIIIDCGSNVGTIEQQSNNFAAIEISGSGINVTLRHLYLEGFGTGQAGIFATATNINLVVENCIIDGFNNTGGARTFYGMGIFFGPLGTRSSMTVSNTAITGSNNTVVGASYGILAQPNTSGEILSVNLIGVLLANNEYGVAFSAGGGVIAGVVVNSRVIENTANGITVGGASDFITVDSSTIADNLANGIASTTSGANVAVTNTTITGNGTGVSGSAVTSFTNNRLFLNGTNGSFGSTQSQQ